MEKENEKIIDHLGGELRKVTKEIEVIYRSLDELPSKGFATNREGRRQSAKHDVKVQRLNAKLDKLNAKGGLIIDKLRVLGAI